MKNGCYGRWGLFLFETFLLFFVYADNQPPTVNCPNTVPAMNVDPGMPDVAINWSPMPTASDTVEGSIDASTIICSDNSGNVVRSGDRFSVHLTTVTCRVSDSVPQEGMCQFNITVVGRYEFCTTLPPGFCISVSLLVLTISLLTAIQILLEIIGTCCKEYNIYPFASSRQC